MDAPDDSAEKKPPLARRLQTTVAAWRRNAWRRVRDWFSASLFRVILGWALLAVLLFTALVWLWGGGFPWSRGWWIGGSTHARVAPIEVVKVALTTIGGIGAVGYLVIKYRERASAERDEKASVGRDAEARLLAAVEQLGSDSPQVRIAGVYALTDVADTYKGSYKQRVVDILCGYLRTERGQWEPATGDEDESAIVVKGRRCVSTDGPVESTVLEVLARHLRNARPTTDRSEEVIQEVDDDQLWCDCSIDLHNAIFVEPLTFDGLAFNTPATFEGALFIANATFDSSTFVGPTRFKNVEFVESSNFRNSTFGDVTTFERATFSGSTIFTGVVSSDTISFNEANFVIADFNNSSFERVDFERAFFTVVDIRRTSFSFAVFAGATFYTADFWKAYFSARTDFRYTTYIFGAGFREAKFMDYTDFCSAKFKRKADFEGADFSGIVNFEGALFNYTWKTASNSAITFPVNLKVDSNVRLPPGARWAKFDEDGYAIEDDNPAIRDEGEPPEA